MNLPFILAQDDIESAAEGGMGIIEKLQQWAELIPGGVGIWLFAIILLFVGFWILKQVRKLVEKLMEKTNIDDKIAKLLGQETANSEKAVGAFVFYFLLVILLIFVLNLVGQEDLVASLQGMLNQFLEFIPKLVGAGVLGFITYIIAKVAREILTGILSSARVDERLGTGEGKPITNAVGIVAFFGIILLMLPAVLGLLELNSVSEPISDVVNQIFGYIPNLFAGVILFAIGYLIATIVQKVLSNVLAAIGADALPSKLGHTGDELIGGKKLSDLAGIVAMASILVVLGAQAIEKMQLGFISDLSKELVPGYFNILIAVIIFAVAFFVANFLSKLVPSPFWAKVVKIGVIVFLGAVALQKANISSLTNETFQVLITAAIVAGAFALGVGGAIAIGLGGRERAKKFLDRFGSNS
ncbi:MAG: mechanosensitive ion channel [Verrucomicrobiales bacterium]|nr:mechanosensitive ion channel [Verrucomicrobiales bacterium]